jgi:hypothetical protein
MEWTTQLFRRGGWTMVSNAFTKLPLSTEQILHPEKYFNYERPVRVVLPDVTNLLNANSSAVSSRQSVVSSQHTGVSNQQSPVTAGASPAPVRTTRSRRRAGANRPLPAAQRPLPTPLWHRIDSDINGEWTYYLILYQFLNSPAESKRAAAGWAGDRYAIYEGPEGQVFLAQVAAWDTEDDAREFFDAYVKRTDLRYPGAKQLDSSALEPETQNPKSETRNLYSWNTSESRVIVELRGFRVVTLEGIPSGVNANALLRAFCQ